MNILNSVYPITSGKVSIKKNKENYLILDRPIKKDLIANKDLAELLVLCNGQNSKKDIIQKIKNKGDYHLKQISEEVDKILLNLSQDKIISFKKEKENVKMRVRENNFDYPLNFVYLEVTKKCNFRCIHCYAMSPSISKHQKPQNELKREDYFRLIDRLDDMGVMSIYVTGGEPFRRKDILEILEYINLKGIDFSILTNGSLLNNYKIKRLKSINPRSISISFDDYRKEQFEKIRGEGTYEKVLGNIEKLVRQKIQPKIGSVFFNKINDSYKSIKEFLLFLKCKGLGKETISFDEFIPCGEGKKRSSLIIDEKKVMKDLKRAYGEVFYDNPMTKKNVSIRNLTSNTFCGLGKEIIHIDSVGNVCLCPALSSKEYIAGNVLKEDIQQIWENSKIFNYFRNKEYLNNSKCIDCNSLEDCIGGCKARSFAFSNKFNAEDPWMCAYYGK